MKFFVVECEALGCVAEFYLNDVPVIRRGPGVGDFYSAPLNHLLRSGMNELTIVVEPGPTPAEALVGEGGERRWHIFSEPASARFSLASYPRGAVAGGPDKTLLTEVTWKGNPGRKRVPLVASARVEVEDAVGEWEWEKAPRVELGEGERGEIKALLEELRGSLVSGQIDRYIELTGPRLAEIESAYAHLAGTKAGQLRMANADNQQDPEFALKPLNPGEFDLRVCGEGRLVECVTRDWEAILCEKPNKEGAYGAYPALVSKVAGSWRVVR